MLLAVVVVTMLAGALVPDDGVRPATPERALWVDPATDFAGRPRAAIGPVEVGADNAVPMTG